jgi:hypothetical protein
MKRFGRGKTMQLEEITAPEWKKVLERVYGRVSDNPKCAPILRDIGCIRFQMLFTDRSELSFWEDYYGDRIVPHLGIAEDYTVQAATTFPVLVGTLLRRISIMEAAADESYELRGDTEALMRCANILPYVMVAFTQVVQSEMLVMEGNDR